MRAPLARGVRSPVLWVSVCWRRGELGAWLGREVVLWELLIWRKGDETRLLLLLLLAPPGEEDW